MRIGNNPHKNQVHGDSGFTHQVIIPVYLPSTDGYFKDGFVILRLCLESLFRTVHHQTFVTVVNNGSSREVADYLNELHQNGSIHELVQTVNCGKINSVLKGLAGSNFPLVTIADADVLFLNNWQSETYRIFEAFPKAGAVCPTPSSKSYKNYTENIWFDLLLSKKMRFTSVKNPKAMKAFAESIDNPQFYNHYQLDQYLTITNKQARAVVGAGHFAVTYKNEIFENQPTKYSNLKLGGERDVLDVPVIEQGYWRLSTEDNFAYHMGNIFEPWMQQVVDGLHTNEVHLAPTKRFKRPKTNFVSWWLISTIMGKMLAYRPARRLLLRAKGLDADAAEHYL